MKNAAKKMHTKNVGEIDPRNKKTVDRTQTATAARKNRKVKEVILTRKKIDLK